MKALRERVDHYRISPVVAALRSLYPLIVGVVIAWFLQELVAPAIGPFKAKLVLDIGIAIVAASSLNIVNGFAGQFSIGHAGFMMVGGYAAAWLTYYGSIELWGSAEDPRRAPRRRRLLFLAACLLAGVVAAIAGFVVGPAVAAAARRLPRDRHARLRRDRPRARSSAPATSCRPTTTATSASPARPATSAAASASAACRRTRASSTSTCSSRSC